MGLNETLDRLAREREAKETDPLQGYENAIVKSYAEQIFFGRMLKDINHGMSQPKIEEMIDRSIMIARKLYDKINAI